MTTPSVRTRAAAALAALMLLAPQLALAQRDASSASSTGSDRGMWEKRKEAIQQRLEGLQEKQEVKREEIRLKLEEGMRQRVQAFSARVFTGIGAALDRIEALDAKIEERISSLAARGVDTAASEEKLEVARDRHADAVEALSDLEASFTTAVANETSRPELMGILQEARTELRSVRQAYVDVLVTLRADVRAETSAE